MVKREKVLLGVVGAAAVLAGVYVWRTTRSLPETGAVPTSRARTTTKVEAVPRIGLDRLTSPRAEVRAGSRDLFGFAAPEPPPVPITIATPPPTPAADLAPVAPPPVTLAPVNLKYIGNLDGPQGLKVAFFMTDQKEVLMGQVGEVVMNRFKVVKIGLESVDIQDMGSGSEQLRRLPMRGN